MSCASVWLLAMLCSPGEKPLLVLGSDPLRVGPASVVFTRDTNQIITLSRSGVLTHFDATRADLISSHYHDFLLVRDDGPTHLFSQHGDHLVLLNNQVRVRSLETLSPVASIFEVSSKPSAVALSANANLLAAAFELDRGSTRLRVVKIPYGEVRTLTTLASAIPTMALSADGSKLLTLDTSRTKPQGTARCFDTATGRELWFLDTTATTGLFTPDGQSVWLFAGVNDDASMNVSATTGRDATKLPGLNFAPTTPPKFSNNGKLLLVTTANHAVVYDCELRRVRTQIPVPKTVAAAISPDGARVATITNSLQLWDSQTGRLLSRNSATEHFDIRELRFHPRGGELAQVTTRGQLVRWSFDSPQPRVNTMTEPNATLVASEQGWRMRVLGERQLVETEFIGDQRISTTQFAPVNGPVSSLTFSTDGSIGRASTKGGPVVWNTVTHELFPWTQPTTLSPGGRWLVTEDRSIGHAATGAGVPLGIDHRNARAVPGPFALGHRLQACIVIDQTKFPSVFLAIIELATGRIVCKCVSISVEQFLPQISSEQMRFGFSPDDRVLAFVTPFQTYLIDALSGNRIAVIPNTEPTVTPSLQSPHFRLSHNHRLIALSLGHGGIAIYPLPPLAPVAKFADDTTCILALGNDDPAIGRLAMEQLVTHPNAVSLIRDMLPKPVPKPQPADIPALIAKLDSNVFRDRDAAHRQLLLAGRAITPHLRAALAVTESSEVRSRLEALLKRERNLLIPRPTGDSVKYARCVEVLERIGSREAIAVLEHAVAHDADARLAEEAAFALARLKLMHPPTNPGSR